MFNIILVLPILCKILANFSALSIRSPTNPNTVKPLYNAIQETKAKQGTSKKVHHKRGIVTTVTFIKRVVLYSSPLVSK